MRVLLLLVLAAPTVAHAGSTLHVVSWNLRHEGWNGDRDYVGDAETIAGAFAAGTSGTDAAFLQEVMDTTVPAQIAAELTKQTGCRWSSVVSPLVGRSSYRESYAVVYRPDRVAILSAVLLLDVGDRFEREPWIVKARDRRTDADYTFLDWHTVFGRTADRRAEIGAIASVFEAVQEADASDQDVIVLGDHNAGATSSWWAPLTAVSPPVSARVDVPTTLNRQGEWASAYDHVWIQADYTTELTRSGRVLVADPVAFVRLSDHAPIWFELVSSADTD